MGTEQMKHSEHPFLGPDDQEAIPVVKVAYDMVRIINEANDGRNTELLSARELIQEAQEMCSGLEQILDESPEIIGEALTALRNAIQGLKDAIKQVH